jgi:hypothetical protein
MRGLKIVDFDLDLLYSDFEKSLAVGEDFLYAEISTNSID